MNGDKLTRWTAVAAVLAVLFVLLVFTHPAAAAAVIGTELAVCAVLGLLIRRAARFRSCPHLWRTA